jgi:hypothetical protein
MRKMNKIKNILIVIALFSLNGCLADQMVSDETTPWIIEDAQKPSDNLISSEIEDAKHLHPIVDDRGVSFVDSLKKYCSTADLNSISYGRGGNTLLIELDLLQECPLPDLSNRNVYFKINNVSGTWFKLTQLKDGSQDYNQLRYMHLDEMNGYVYYLKLEKDTLIINIYDISCDKNEEIITDFSEKLNSIEFALEEITTKTIFKSQKFIVEKNKILHSGNTWSIIPDNGSLKLPLEGFYCAPRTEQAPVTGY